MGEPEDDLWVSMSFSSLCSFAPKHTHILPPECRAASQNYFLCCLGTPKPPPLQAPGFLQSLAKPSK